jgi:hypothetical protein
VVQDLLDSWYAGKQIVGRVALGSNHRIQSFADLLVQRSRAAFHLDGAVTLDKKSLHFKVVEQLRRCRGAQFRWQHYWRSVQVFREAIATRRTTWPVVAASEGRVRACATRVVAFV